MFTDAVVFLQKAAVFHPEKDAVLLLRRSADDPVRPNDWDFPGGNVEWGELHEVALRRELLEEAGLTVGDLLPLKIMTKFDEAADVYILRIIYTCRSDASSILLSGEHSEFCWFTERELRLVDPAPLYVALALEALASFSPTAT